MAKRKRASLKDKSPESLGLTPKKGKGIDLLFGGPSDKQQTGAAAQSGPGTESGSDLSGSTDDNTSTDAPSLTGVAATDDRAVDELGLPVALEAPPDDLILASSPAEPVSDEGEVNAVDLSTSPFAMPVTESLKDSSLAGDANDLSGILEEDDSLMVDEEDLSSAFEANDLSGLVEEGAPPDTAAGDDLSGIVEDLSGIVVDDSTAEAVGVPSGADVASTTPPAAPLPSPAPPPTTAAPINVPPPPPAPTYQPVTPAATIPSVGTTPTYPEPATTSTPPAPATTIPPSSTATGAPSAAAPRVQIDTVSGVVTEKAPVSEEDILPEDALTETGSHVLAVEKRSQLEPDDAVTEKVMRYIGRERREKLDQQIEALYDQVANELSDGKDDAAFALKTLSEAQDIVIEDPRQYDEALYRVAVVKTMLVRKKNLRKWSYTWGMFVFFYALVWLAAFIAGFFLPIAEVDQAAGELSPGVIAIRSAWLASLAGGIGGIVAILYSLSWRVAIKHEFDRQYVMKYLVQPVMGFLLGAMIFFITTAGFLFFGGGESLLTQSTEGVFLGVSQLVAIQILLGFIAGFRQRVVYYMIDRIVQKISPKPTESKAPSSVVPTEDLDYLRASQEVSSQQ